MSGIIISCPICGGPFKPGYGKNRKRFCSRKCYFSQYVKNASNQQYMLHFMSQWSRLQSAILGYIWADGNLHLDNRQNWHIGFSCATYDEEVLHQIKDALCSNPRKIIRCDNNFGGSSSYFAIGSTSLAKLLITKFGLMSRKSTNNYYPSVPDEWFSDFLRGYFIGDGCVSQSDTGREFGFVGSEGFIIGLQNQLVSITGMSHNKVSKDNGNCFRTRWSTARDAKLLYEFIFSEGYKFTLERKRLALLKLASR